MSSPSSFSHILISRPDPEGTELAARVAAIGGHPIHLPAFDFELLDPGDWPEWRDSARRLVVFASPRTVRFAAQAWPRDWLDGVQVAALGPATASALNEQGIDVDVLPLGGNHSEGLLASPALGPGEGRAVLVSSPGGRRALADGLSQRGWSVETVCVYRRVPLPINPQVNAELAQAHRILSTWTSGTALKHIVSALDPGVAEKVCAGCFIVISPRLAELAVNLGARHTHIADGPGNDALLSAIRRLSIPESPQAGSIP